MTETWKPVVGYEGYYEVSDMGRVKSLDRVVVDPRGWEYDRLGQIIAACDHGEGYLVLNLAVDTRKTLYLVHRLVGEAFFGLCPEGCQTNHKNGIKADNRVANLEFVTRGENMRHAFRTGLYDSNIGENHYRALLTEDDVLAIRSRYGAGGVTQRQLAEKYGVSRENISGITTGKTWKHLLEEGGATT